MNINEGCGERLTQLALKVKDFFLHNFCITDRKKNRGKKLPWQRPTRTIFEEGLIVETRKNRTIIIVSLAACVGIMTVGCNGSSSAPQTVAPMARAQSRGQVPPSNGLPEVAAALANQIPLGQPVKVGAMLDKSGSATWTRVEQPQVQDFQKLLPLLQENGGELAVGVICDDSNRSLVRVRIEPPPVLAAGDFNNPQMPVSPEDGGNAFELQERRQQYRQELAAYNERLEADRQILENHRQELREWESQSEERIKRFVPQLEPLLERPVDCPGTDIWGAIARTNLFLNENDAVWSRSPRRFAVFITDGIHEAEGKETAIGGGTEVLLINGSASAGVFKDVKHQAFESVSSAFLYLTETANGGK